MDSTQEQQLLKALDDWQAYRRKTVFTKHEFKTAEEKERFLWSCADMADRYLSLIDSIVRGKLKASGGS